MKLGTKTFFFPQNNQFLDSVFSVSVYFLPVCYLFIGTIYLFRVVCVTQLCKHEGYVFGVGCSR